MHILKDKKAVVLRLRDPKKVTDVIPTAKLAKMKGVTVVAVPHRPDEVRVLQNLGFTDIPDPFKTYYGFPGRFTPFGAQVESAAFLTRNPRAFLLNSMGLGKTVTTLWAYDYLRSVKLAKRMLVVCPLSVMERAWADEVFRSFPHLDYAVLYGSADRRKKLLKAKADIYIINVDGLRTISAELAQRDDIDLICVDEVALFRNASTNRWKLLNEVVNRQGVRRCWGLTGAPTPNLPTDAWAQGRVINPTNPDCPKYFNRFRDTVMRQVTSFKWLPRDNATEMVSRVLQPAIRYALDDVVDLPEQLFAERDVELTPEQRHAYQDMMRRLATEYEGGQILAVNEAVKINKLLQIACIAYGTDVLTDCGWTPIQDVTAEHRVWDGEEWVRQGGARYMGNKPVVELDGVYLTADHKVWVGHWVPAQEILYGDASNRFDRPEVRLPDGVTAGGAIKNKSENCAMGMPVRLWHCGRAPKPVPTQPRPYVSTKLRVPSRERNAQDVGNAAFWGMERDAFALHQQQRPQLAELRRAWYCGLRAVGKFVRELLGRYETNLPAWAYAGPDQRGRPVLARELSVGYAKRTSQQPPQTNTHRYTQRAYDGSRSSARVQHQPSDNLRSSVAVQMASGAVVGTPVYDLINCGPRHRFVVRGKDGQCLIVHNCGVAYGESDDVVFPARPRIEVVKEIIEESEGKSIVFVPFTGALNNLAKELSADYSVAVVHGETKKQDRDRIFHSFQNEDDPRVLIANPGTLSHGLTLTAATTLIWFCPINSNEMYQQANARVRRPGQKRTTIIVHVAGCDVERKMYDRLAKKEGVQGVLLDLIKQASKEVVH